MSLNVKEIVSHDSVVFIFSGHSLRLLDYNTSDIWKVHAFLTM